MQIFIGPACLLDAGFQDSRAISIARFPDSILALIRLNIPIFPNSRDHRPRKIDRTRATGCRTISA